MPALVVSRAEVRRLLPMDVCIDLVADALATLSRGDAQNPLRRGMWLPERRGILAMMPGSLESPRTFGLKVIAVMPGNHGTPYDAHQGVVVLFDHDHGIPVGIVDASEITAIRTAAASGVATRILAREDADDLAILGTGVQARTHLDAMRRVRPVERVRVFSRSPERRRRFAAEEAERHGLEIEASDSAEEAVRGAAIVCTTTASRKPVLFGEWLSPGAHVNAVGSSVATARELDTRAMAMASLFVDRRESVLNEAGDFLVARDEGVVDESHIRGEIGELLNGEVEGRRSAEEITLFESLGLAVEDLVSAHYVYERARAEGLGTRVDLGAFDHAAP